MTQATMLRKESAETTRDASGENRTLVLIIDDDLSVRLMVRQCLEKSGFEVAEATCAGEGLEQFERLRPDVVLCDVVMPDNDGYYVDKSGVLLSPFIRPSRLENFRGLYVRFAGNKDEVMRIVSERIQMPVDDFD